MLKLIRGILYRCGVRSCIFLSDDEDFRWFRHHLVSSEWNLVCVCVRATSFKGARWRKSCIKWTVSCELLTQMWIMFFSKGCLGKHVRLKLLLDASILLEWNWLIRASILKANIGEECLPLWTCVHDSDTEAELVCRRSEWSHMGGPGEGWGVYSDSPVNFHRSGDQLLRIMLLEMEILEEIPVNGCSALAVKAVFHGWGSWLPAVQVSIKRPRVQRGCWEAGNRRWKKALNRDPLPLREETHTYHLS